MGLIDRLKRITLARIEAFLSAAEKPELILPQLVREMQAKLKQVANAEAKSLTAVRSAQRKCDEVAGRLARFREGAALAMKAGDEATARRAIAAQVSAEADAEAHAKALFSADQAYGRARQIRQRFQRDLAELKRRRDEILARARVVQSQQAAQREMEAANTPGDNLLDAVSRIEVKVADAEDELVARHEVARLLDADLHDGVGEQVLGDHEVEKRLSELKRSLGRRPGASE